MAVPLSGQKRNAEQSRRGSDESAAIPCAVRMTNCVTSRPPRRGTLSGRPGEQKFSVGRLRRVVAGGHRGSVQVFKAVDHLCPLASPCWNVCCVGRGHRGSTSGAAHPPSDPLPWRKVPGGTIKHLTPCGPDLPHVREWT